jgi:hypothetical protein
MGKGQSGKEVSQAQFALFAFDILVKNRGCFQITGRGCVIVTLRPSLELRVARARFNSAS